MIILSQPGLYNRKLNNENQCNKSVFGVTVRMDKNTDFLSRYIKKLRWSGNFNIIQ